RLLVAEAGKLSPETRPASAPARPDRARGAHARGFRLMDPAAAGTLVNASGADDETRASSLASLNRQALLHIEVRGQQLSENLAVRFQSTFDELDIPVWLGTLSAFGTSVSAVIPEQDVERARAGLEQAFRLELADGTLDRIRVTHPVAMVTLVAEAMGRTSGVLSKLTGALGSIGVSVLAMGQSASERSISCVVAESDCARAVQTAHAAFHWAHQEVDVFLLGPGTVGRELIDQIQQQQDFLRQEHDVNVRLVGLANSRSFVFEPEGLALERWHEILEEASQTPDLEPTGPVPFDQLEELGRRPLPVLVDCTAEDGMEAMYQAAFASGVHVVAANKKPLTLPLAGYKSLLGEARKRHRAYRYETTVGASLPVIETLRDLVRTGDQVRLVEGSFSGTLGYITDELSKGGELHTIVRRAQEQGFTEPQPQDDLSGLDAARKALILAREIGLALDLADVALEPLVPRAIIEKTSLEDFYAALESYAGEMKAKVAAAGERGEVLRYLARIDPAARERNEPMMTVGPVFVPPTNPAAHLKHAQSFVAFYTHRYRDFPLVVQGAGAGGAVTAAGVLADVLRVAGSLRD
ncbi:MAG: ACT domain-containing protein, partial [Myxococcota bacterium]